MCASKLSASCALATLVRAYVCLMGGREPIPHDSRADRSAEVTNERYCVSAERGAAVSRGFLWRLALQTAFPFCTALRHRLLFALPLPPIHSRCFVAARRSTTPA